MAEQRAKLGDRRAHVAKLLVAQLRTALIQRERVDDLETRPRRAKLLDPIAGSDLEERIDPALNIRDEPRQTELAVLAVLVGIKRLRDERDEELLTLRDR